MTETQLTPIKLCYARDRIAPTSTSAAAAAAIEAAQSMQQYASWEPTEFDEAAAEPLDNDLEKGQEQVESHHRLKYTRLVHQFRCFS